ncbi:hypothetical protein GGR53DRAFT_464281 [Hypoxylon sp. FL1150]|nr:hypothetical protein GGR53DRAFT_464281 [Hypoxylon sp. FL1150]
MKEDIKIRYMMQNRVLGVDFRERRSTLDGKQNADSRGNSPRFTATCYQSIVTHPAPWCCLGTTRQSSSYFRGVARLLRVLETPLDIIPGSIIVDPKPDTDKVISAVIDWDHAVFAPQFVSCTPPEGLELDQIFEEAASPEYLRLAYTPANQFARQLVRFAIEPLSKSEDIDNFLGFENSARQTLTKMAATRDDERSWRR